MQYEEFRAMNSDIILAASGDDDPAIHSGFSTVRQFINSNEQRFTRFTETSELAELNRSAGRWFEASADMFEVMQLAQQLAAETRGLFNPAVLQALKHAGYDRSMDDIRSDALKIEVDEADDGLTSKVPDFQQIKLDPTTKSIFLPKGMQVDLGGIAKGWIAEQAARRLAEVSEACAVSAGGDMYLVNLPGGEADWEIGLEDPLQPEQNLAILHVMPGAVATSSISKRKWQHYGRLQHHLIDPRSGLPAQTEWLSTTVWAEHAVEAEVYAKALLIGGVEEAQELFKNKNTKAYLTVDKRGWVHGSKNYHEVFHV